MCFLILIGSLCIKGTRRRGGVGFHSGKEAAYLVQMCVDTLSSCLIRYREARPLCLPSQLFFFFFSHFHFSRVPLHLSCFTFSIAFPSSLHVHLISPIFLPVQRRKMIQTMEMSTYQLLVAISSRLPQSQIGPQIK